MKSVKRGAFQAAFLFLSGMESVSAGRVQAITGAILSYSSSASAPNLDPIAFKEAALARLRNVAVSFESGAARSTLAVALADATNKHVSRAREQGSRPQMTREC